MGWKAKATYLLLSSQPRATKLARTDSAADLVILVGFTGSRIAAIDETLYALLGARTISSTYDYSDALDHMYRTITT